MLGDEPIETNEAVWILDQDEQKKQLQTYVSAVKVVGVIETGSISYLIGLRRLRDAPAS